MTTRAIARHRAEVTKTNSLAVIAKAVGDNAGGMGRQAAVIAAASGLVLTERYRSQRCRHQRPARSHLRFHPGSPVFAPANISAASTIAISYEKPAVSTSPAPVVEAPKPVVEVQEAEPAAAAGCRCNRQRWPHPLPQLRPRLPLPAASAPRLPPPPTPSSASPRTAPRWSPTRLPLWASTSTTGRQATCPWAAPSAPQKHSPATSLTTQNGGMRHGPHRCIRRQRPGRTRRLERRNHLPVQRQRRLRPGLHPR